MGSLLFNLGGWCFRHRRWVLAGWLVVIIGLAGLATSVKKPTTSQFSIPGTQSQRALDLLNHHFPGTGGAQAQVVFSVGSTTKLTDPAERAAVEATLAGLRQAPEVVSVSDPYATGTISASEQIAYATVAYPVAASNVSAAAKYALLHSGGPAEKAGIAVHYGGQVAKANNASGTEVIGVLVAFVVLLLAFGSIWAAVLPLVAAIVGVAITDLGLTALTGVITESSSTSILAIMIGLAVGIDYSLFILNRHRQQLAAGTDPQESVARALATSGAAVCFAGVTVLIALAALSIVNIPFLTVMGLAAAGAVVAAVLVSITLTPAMLGFVGPRLITSRRARRQLEKASAPGFRPLSNRYVSAITRLPVAAAVILVGVVALLVVASPARHIRLALPDAGTQPTSETTRQAYDLISEGFGPGSNGPLLAVVYAPGKPTAAQRAAFASYYALAQTKSSTIASVSKPRVNPAGNLAIVTVTPRTGPTDPKTKALIGTMRSVAEKIQNQTGLQTYVTGQTAINIDVSSKISAALPTYLAVVVLLCVLLLLAVFRSLAIPAKAVIGYILSVLACLGAVTFIFQNGHLDKLFGIAKAGPILSFLPVLLIGVLFGLAMDYEVFLVSRMREEYVHRPDPRRAIIDGYSGSAKVVASAGIIMIAVFAAFILAPDPTTKSFGVSLALGVAIDAFVVRMTLVPAVMAFAGKGAWWIPRFLARVVPNFDVEGDGAHTRPVAIGAEISKAQNALSKVELPAQ
jgi:uncharacterized membrane protein YdfJ with MMPL/SSD domain